MERKAKAAALCAVFLALTAVFGALPYVFLLPVLIASVTTDFKTSLIVSVFFGVISLLYALMSGSLVAVAFVAQPWIPIAARIFVGPAARGAYLLTNKIVRKEGRLKKILPVCIGGAVGSLVNTALVVCLLVLTSGSVEVGGVTVIAYVSVMLISGAIELAVNTIVLPPLALTLGRLGLIKPKPACAESAAQTAADAKADESAQNKEKEN